MSTSFKNQVYSVLVLLVLFWIIFSPLYPDLVSAWMNNSDDSHGALVPLISGFLIWKQRRRLADLPIERYDLGGVLLAASLLVYVLSYAGAVSAVSRLMFVSGLMGLVLFNCGKSVFRILAFPLCFLIFMVPVPVSIHSILAHPLQLFASRISALLIQAVNIPVLREGNMLYFAQAQLEVAEACSGLRSMTAFIMLSSLFAYMMKTSWIRRMGMILSAIPLALLANIVRVTGSGILAHHIGGRAAQGFLHDFSGVAVFAFGLTLLWLEYSILERIGTKAPADG